MWTSKAMGLVFVAGFLIVCSGNAADWPNWRGPNHDGISVEKDWEPAALNEQKKPVWQAQVGTGFSSISVADGKAVTCGNIDGNTDVVSCFDAVSGSLLWKYEYPEPLSSGNYEGGPNATPTITDGKVYTLSKSGKAFCLNLKDGKVLWQAQFEAPPPKWGLAGSPVIIGKMVIYNAAESGIALDKNSGQVIWKSENKKAGYASTVPMDADGKQILIFGRESLICLKAEDGALLWSYPWKTDYDVNASDPIVNGSEVFITSGYNHGCALLKIADAGPSVVWENKNMRSQISGPVLIDGFIYGIDDNRLVCLDWATGQSRWTEGSVGKGSLMAADGKLIVLSENGKLIIAKASPEGFKELSSAQVLSGRCWTMPVLANGFIYARNAKGDIVCMDIRKKAAKASGESSVPFEVSAGWPEWQGPSRDNKSTETGLLKRWPQGGPKMLWSFQGLGKGFSTVAIAGGKIYTTGMIGKEGMLFCINLDGRQLWRQPYGPEWSKSHPGVRCTPTVIDGRVYVISGLGQAGCFDAQSGQKIWQSAAFTEFGGKYISWGIAESPLVVDGRVIVTVGGQKATMVALDAKDGGVVWASDSIGDTSAYCSPVVVPRSGRRLIITMTSDHIIGVDSSDGKILWKYAVGSYVKENRQIHPNSPVYQDDMVLCASGSDMGAIMLRLTADGSKVDKVWTNPVLDTHHGSMAVVDGYIYSSNWSDVRDGSWYCAKWDSGQVLYERHWKCKGSLTWAEGMLYCYEEKGGTVALVRAEPSGFEPVSEFVVSLGDGEHFAHPVVCGKRLYIRHGDVLMAYDIAGQQDKI